MCDILRVRWTIIPSIAPRPWMACSGCGTLKPFQSSGKIRLNANGRKLDAWLIYRCLDCDKTWTRPIFERRNVRDVDPAILEALHANDPDWVRRQEFDVDALRRRVQRVEEFAQVDIRKETLSGGGNTAAVVIMLKVPMPASLRLDRLLRLELGLSRSVLHGLYERAELRVDPDRKDVLRRRIRGGTCVIVDIPAGPDAGIGPSAGRPHPFNGLPPFDASE